MILISSQFTLMKEAQSEHYCFIFSNIYQNNDIMRSGLPPTSSQLPPISSSSYWPNWDLN